MLSTRISAKNLKRQIQLQHDLEVLDPQTLNYMMQSQLELPYDHLTAESGSQYQQQKLTETQRNALNKPISMEMYDSAKRKQRKVSTRQQRKVNIGSGESTAWSAHPNLNLSFSNLLQSQQPKLPKPLKPQKTLILPKPMKSLSLKSPNFFAQNDDSRFFALNTGEIEIKNKSTKTSQRYLNSNPKPSPNPIANNFNFLAGIGGYVTEPNKWKKVQSNMQQNATKPFSVSTSAGGKQTIVVSSSRTIRTSTDRSNGLNKSNQNTKHRKETLKQRTTKIPSTITQSNASKGQFQWRNKYNIDYDNKLEDEYEIILKEE